MIYDQIKKYIMLGLVSLLIICFFFTVYYRYNYINSDLLFKHSNEQNKLLQSEINKQNKNITEYKKEIEAQILSISELNDKSRNYKKYIDELTLTINNRDIQKEIKTDKLKANTEINKELNLKFKNIMDMTK